MGFLEFFESALVGKHRVASVGKLFPNQKIERIARSAIPKAIDFAIRAGDKTLMHQNLTKLLIAAGSQDDRNAIDRGRAVRYNGIEWF